MDPILPTDSPEPEPPKSSSITSVLVLAVVGGLLAVVLARLVMAPAASARDPGTVCHHRALQIYSAIESWAQQTAATSAEPLRDGTAPLAPAYIAAFPTCPSGAAYLLGQPNGLVVCPNHTFTPRPPARRPWLIRLLQDIVPGSRRVSASRMSCIANLRQIDGAIEQWALENKRRVGDPVQVTNGITAYLKGGTLPVCTGGGAAPSGGVYLVSKVGELPRCTHEAKTFGHRIN